MGSIFFIWAIVNPHLFTMTETDQSAMLAFNEKGFNITLNDFKYKNNNLHYARIGDSTKKALLFVHGSPGSWVNSWDYFMDSSWHTDYELISVDRPGFGKSDYGKARNLFKQSEIITAFVKDKLKGRQVQLIGHSYGGPLVLQLCADNDTLYDKCIIMAGSINPEAEKNEWQLNLFSKPILKWTVPGSFEQGMEELLWLKEDLKSNKYLTGLSKIKTPIVAIYGTKDKMVPYKSNVDFLKKRFPSDQIEVHPIKDGSHFIPWNNYAEMRQLIIGKSQ